MCIIDQCLKRSKAYIASYKYTMFLVYLTSSNPVEINSAEMYSIAVQISNRLHGNLVIKMLFEVFIRSALYVMRYNKMKCSLLPNIIIYNVNVINEAMH